MIEDNFLNFFITEEIYQLPEEPLSALQKEETPPMTAATKETQTRQSELSKSEELPEPPSTKTITYPLAIWSPPLTTKDRELITNILKAVHEDISKCHLMEGLAAYEANYEKLLCFGYQKELELKLANQVQLYKPTEISGKQVLLSVAPADLHDSAAEKKRLWEGLQEMFLKS